MFVSFLLLILAFRLSLSIFTSLHPTVFPYHLHYLYSHLFVTLPFPSSNSSSPSFQRRNNSIRMAVIMLIIYALIFITHSVDATKDPPKLSEVDLRVLVSIKDSITDLPGSTFFTSWDFTQPDPCSSFAGVTCALSSSPSNVLRVTVLELGTGLYGSLGLAGMIPETISQLTELTQLILNAGMVTGPIPAQIGRLTGLRVLFSSHNRLTGPIPSSISELSQLHTLDLSFNHLTNCIPPNLFTKLTHLKVLVLAGNQLTGEISAVSHLLFHLDLKLNQFTGSIPKSLPITLHYVSLSRNNMWGPINGTILDSLPNLSYLDLSYNQFSGALPGSLFKPSLFNLLLSHNNFSSVMHASEPDSDRGLYPGGSTLDLSHNSFSGGLPIEAAGVENIYLNNNRFSGSVPGPYADGVRDGKIKTLYLQHNFLDGFPKNVGPTLPENAEVCLAYNCMVPPLGLDLCPTSAGGRVSRPASQCSMFHNGS